MAAGDLDPSFGAGGTVVTDFGPDSVDLDFARDVAIQPDGKIVAVGSSFSSFALARYNPDGSLDTSFGDVSLGKVGLVVTRVNVGGSFVESAEGVGIQADGKIVITGTTAGPNGSVIAVLRYNADGTIDDTFDGDGFAFIDLVPAAGPGETLVEDRSNEAANDLVIQADGKIVIVGSAIESGTFSTSGGGTVIRSGDNNFLAARFNPDGSLDTPFGTAGVQVVDFPTSVGSSSDVANAVAIQADGKIVLAGERSSGFSVFFTDSFAIARLNADGSIDTGFGTNGRQTVEFDLGGTNGNNIDRANAVAIQADGKIVLAGTAFTGQVSLSLIERDFAVARLDADGALDPTFDADGRQTIAFDLGGDNVDEAEGVAIQADGRVVLAGVVETSPNADFGLARLNPDGSLDPTFGGDGRVTTNFGAPDIGDAAYALAIQADGRLIAAGESGANPQSNLDFALARYFTDSIPPTVLDVVDVTPDPRTTPVDTVDVVFSEPILASSFTIADLALTRDGAAVPLGSGLTIAPVAGTPATFRISGLTPATTAPGAYMLTVNAPGVVDLANNPGVGAATDSFTVVGVTVADISVAEGDVGNTDATLTVTVPAALAQALTFSFATTPGTATAGEDYVAATGTVTIPAGQTTATFAIPIIGDFLREANETFTVEVSLAGGQGQTSMVLDSAVVTIADDEVLVVTNTNDAGAGSLRDAILVANASDGLDTITFNIPGVGVRRIRPLSALPTITDEVIIDGTTQPGFSTIDPWPQIELCGDGIPTTSGGPLVNGLVITGGGSTVRGLVINQFSSHGIVITGPGNNTIRETFIGTDPAGIRDLGNAGVGILVVDSPNNVIGGTDQLIRTLVSGNGGCGIIISGIRATGNMIRGTIVGADINGVNALPNGYEGIGIVNAARTLIGGPVAGAQAGVLSAAGNLISGNLGHGLSIVGPPASDTVVMGNFIGTNKAGTAAIPNFGGGIEIVCGARTMIGDVGAGGAAITALSPLGNLISGNRGHGLTLAEVDASDVVIRGNFIGTDLSGMNALPNAGNGILALGVPTLIVGGPRAGAASGLGGASNLISGNALNGIYIISGGPGIRVEGNFIGTDLAGSGRLPNGTLVGPVFGGQTGPELVPPDDLGLAGVRASNTRLLTIGGAGGAGNLISGNGGLLPSGLAPTRGRGAAGIILDGSGSQDDQILGNRIGTNLAGNLDLGNSFHGIYLLNARDNLIASNVVSGNGNPLPLNPAGRSPGDQTGVGIYLSGGNAKGNRIEGNRIGVDADGLVNVSNSFVGVLLTNAPQNIVGGTSSAASNVISGNGAAGVIVFQSSAPDAIPGPATGNIVMGNIIGLDATGTQRPLESLNPVRVTADGMIVRAPSGLTRPFIQNTGVLVQDASATRVLNNVISGQGDINPLQLSSDPNFLQQVGRRGVGVSIFNAPEPTGMPPVVPSDNVIEGNFIGTNLNGVAADSTEATDPDFQFETRTLGVFSATGNAGSGILIIDSPNNIVGGPSTSQGNIIARNGGNGVLISGRMATGMVLSNNAIGLALASGSMLQPGAPLPLTPPGSFVAAGNQLFGVLITDGAANTTIESSNLIQNNGRGSVMVNMNPVADPLQAPRPRTRAGRTAQAPRRRAVPLRPSQAASQVAARQVTFPDGRQRPFRAFRG